MYLDGYYTGLLIGLLLGSSLVLAVFIWIITSNDREPRSNYEGEEL